MILRITRTGERLVAKAAKKQIMGLNKKLQ